MKKTIFPQLALFLLISWNLQSSPVIGKFIPADTIKPANRNASPEAIALLKYIYSLSGSKTLTAQHENLGKMSVMTDTIFKLTGKKPAIWGGEFGFADSTHDIDNINYRPKLVPEIIKQHKNGAIITLTYHQANPAIGEPCPFQGGVISKLTDLQWQDLLTPGTQLYEKWIAQMDLLAGYLKKLQDARIPVLFRPYHEMNGSWFWWGGRKGENGSMALYKQLYHYYTDVHHLNNLIWVWGPDKPWHGLKEFYPGDEYVDIIGCDIYPVKDTTVVYRKEWYDELAKLAGNKPLALTEHSVLPGEAILESQPRWVWMMAWVGMLLNANKPEAIKAFYNSGRTITRDELPDWIK